MLFYCWPAVEDGGPTLKQHWIDVSYLMGGFHLNKRGMFGWAVPCPSGVRAPQPCPELMDQTVSRDHLPQIRQVAIVWTLLPGWSIFSRIKGALMRVFWLVYGRPLGYISLDFSSYKVTAGSQYPNCQRIHPSHSAYLKRHNQAKIIIFISAPWYVHNMSASP